MDTDRSVKTSVGIVTIVASRLGVRSWEFGFLCGQRIHQCTADEVTHRRRSTFPMLGTNEYIRQTILLVCDGCVSTKSMVDAPECPIES